MTEAVLNSRTPAPPPLGELTTNIHINTAEIPNHVQDNIAAATLELLKDILAQPGGREMLDAKIKAKQTTV